MTDVLVRLKKDEKYFVLSGDFSQWQCALLFGEGQARETNDGIVVAGKLEAGSGVRNFDDKGWKPDGQLVKFILHDKTYKKWVKGDDGKLKVEDTEPSTMELFFHKRFNEFIKKYGNDGGACFKGNIKIDALSEVVFNAIQQGKKVDGSDMSEETISALSEQFFGIVPSKEPHFVPDSELESFAIKDGYGGKGGYKSVSEKEKLSSRLEFLKEQFPILFPTGSEKLDDIIAVNFNDDKSGYIQECVRAFFQILTMH